MKLRKLRKNIKAISPIISVLLMIAVAVAAALVTYAWVMGYLNFTTNKVNNGIQIQSLSWTNDTATTGPLLVYVQNVGSSTVKFDSASCLYVDGVMQTGTTIAGANPAKSGSTLTFAVADFEIKDLPHTLQIKVVTADGTMTQATQSVGS